MAENDLPKCSSKYNPSGLYTKICKRCNKTFRTDKSGSYICPTCQRDRLKALYREKKAQEKAERRRRTIIDIPLDRMVIIIEQYNAEHKTHYTYGQFVEKLKDGEITIERRLNELEVRID